MRNTHLLTNRQTRCSLIPLPISLESFLRSDRHTCTTNSCLVKQRRDLVTTVHHTKRFRWHRFWCLRSHRQLPAHNHQTNSPYRTDREERRNSGRSQEMDLWLECVGTTYERVPIDLAYVRFLSRTRSGSSAIYLVHNHVRKWQLCIMYRKAWLSANC